MIVRHRYPTATFDRSFDRAFEQITNSFFDSRRQAGPVVDGVWHDDEYVLTVDLPGVPAEAVSIEATGNTLTLAATTETMEWQRSLRLGGRLDPEKIVANHRDGRLTVRIGTFDAPEARVIAIDTTPTPAAIEATSDDAGQSTDTNSAE
jgi:HSP20 family protein